MATKTKANPDVIAGKIRRKMGLCCSSTWAQDVEMGRTNYPIPGMTLSRCYVSTGDSNPRGTVGTRRWTPRNIVDIEDRLDGMSYAAARAYYHPPAIRYDHATPREFREFDPRTPLLASAHRVTMLECWRVKRESVRIRRGRNVIAFEKWYDFPESPCLSENVDIS